MKYVSFPESLRIIGNYAFKGSGFLTVSFPKSLKHIGMRAFYDCNVPGAIRFCRSILPESLDTCEGGRFSCYIGADMVMLPYSFDQQKKYKVSLKGMTIEEAWNSKPFEAFRDKMRNACPECEKRDLCMGGCPLMPEIVFCDSKKRSGEE